MIKSLFSHPSFWVMLAAGTFGGALVVWGLILEGNDKIRSRGERLVITGVCMEVIGAIIVTILSGLETVTSENKLKQTENQTAVLNYRASTNEMEVAALKSINLVLKHELESINPSNSPVMSASAQLNAVFEYTHSDVNPPRLAHAELSLGFHDPTRPRNNGGPDTMFKFTAPQVVIWDAWSYKYDLIINFPLDTYQDWRIAEPPPTLNSYRASDINRISWVKFGMSGVTTNMSITGTLTVFFNSTPRTFFIHTNFDASGRIAILGSYP